MSSIGHGRPVCNVGIKLLFYPSTQLFQYDLSLQVQYYNMVAAVVQEFNAESAQN